MASQEPTKEQAGAATAPGTGLTLVILKDDKIAEILDRGRDLLEAQFRHSMELSRAGIGAVLKEGDGCCNCVAC